MSTFSTEGLFRILTLPFNQDQNISSNHNNNNNELSQQRQQQEQQGQQQNNDIISSSSSSSMLHNIEKQQIIDTYERQLQRLMSHLSIALKHIEFLESYRREMNRWNRSNANANANENTNATQKNKSSQHECEYHYMHRQIYYLNQELVLLRDMYENKLLYVSDEYNREITILQKQIVSLQANHNDNTSNDDRYSNNNNNHHHHDHTNYDNGNNNNNNNNGDNHLNRQRPSQILDITITHNSITGSSLPSLATATTITTVSNSVIETLETHTTIIPSDLEFNSALSASSSSFPEKILEQSVAQPQQGLIKNISASTDLEEEEEEDEEEKEKEKEKEEEEEEEEDHDIRVLRQSFAALHRSISKRNTHGDDLQKQIDTLKHQNKMLQDELKQYKDRQDMQGTANLIQTERDIKSESELTHHKLDEADIAMLPATGPEKIARIYSDISETMAPSKSPSPPAKDVWPPEMLMSQQYEEKINNMRKQHLEEMEQLRDEYLNRLEYQRQNTQEYLNIMLQKTTANQSVNRSRPTPNDQKDIQNNKMSAQSSRRILMTDSDGESEDDLDLKPEDLEEDQEEEREREEKKAEETKEKSNTKRQSQRQSKIQAQTQIQSMEDGIKEKPNLANSNRLSVAEANNHLRDDSVSNSADQIIPSLVIGLDNTLDRILSQNNGEENNDPYGQHAANGPYEAGSERYQPMMVGHWQSKTVGSPILSPASRTVMEQEQESRSSGRFKKANSESSPASLLLNKWIINNLLSQNNNNTSANTTSSNNNITNPNNNAYVPKLHLRERSSGSSLLSFQSFRTHGSHRISRILSSPMLSRLTSNSSVSTQTTISTGFHFSSGLNSNGRNSTVVGNPTNNIELETVTEETERPLEEEEEEQEEASSDDENRKEKIIKNYNEEGEEEDNDHETMGAILNDVWNNLHNKPKRELIKMILEYEENGERVEFECKELQDKLDQMINANADLERELEKLRSEIRKHNLEKFDYRSKRREYKELQRMSSEWREKHAQLTLKYFSLECEHERITQEYQELVHQLQEANMNASSGERAGVLMNMDAEEEENENEHMSQSYRLGLVNGFTASLINTSGIDEGHHNDRHDGGRDRDDDHYDDDDEMEADITITFEPNENHHKDKEKKKEKDNMTSHNSYSNIKHEESHSKFPNLSLRKISSNGLKNIGSEEMLDEIARLKEQLRDMNESKYALLKSSREEIERLHNYIARLRRKEPMHKYYTSQAAEEIPDEKESNNNHNAHHRARSDGVKYRDHVWLSPELNSHNSLSNSDSQNHPSKNSS